ncbi:DNA replication ATP-dependent helicase/nuclease DNA2 [Cynara cardunculus var. scolymus]|uniref:DNA replication ATP-dependent helicase/nuclease DNA2 n=1 Tax=Cynara cardunculus var. scolymus TaxID=59895 RepID=UPI000D62A85A|nr:DNA replication ATP-dependent helicase/nuclease DNA2 [Cynara cardunculus var. scolymus]
MAPRKKAAAGASKKSNQIQQQPSQKPSKFGIQHFFERHTQNSVSQNPQKQQPAIAKEFSVDVGSVPERPLDPVASTSTGVVVRQQSDSSFGTGINPRKDLGLENANNNGDKNPYQSTTIEDLTPVARDDATGNQLEVSPEFCKSVSRKRIKFSPGMLIHQSQDDGGDEVTWRISPVNERLHALTKNLVEVRKVLGESSRFNIVKFKPSSEKASAENSLKFLKGITLGKCNLDQDMISFCNNEKATDKNNINFRSPFKTPPSCHNKTADSDDTYEESTQLGLRQHKKALLELLDQVEDAICVEDQVCTDKSTSYQNEHSNERCVEPDVAVEGLAVGSSSTRKVKTESSNVYFLVFEVSEKQFVGSNGSQCSSKVLRLLNEQCGEERSVYLSDEWFYSVIAPGDTVHVIGEFNEGKCEVNRDNNFLIVHPDILVSGTRVAGSFSCPRRTVLDERLKSNEQSASALVGTLLHQLFQAGLIRETPTKEFLEEYARVLLQKNYESLYACGVYEGDIHKTMIDAIPRLLNWILLFRDSQGPMTPSVDFGSVDGHKKVNISEIIDIEEMAWAPKYGLKGVIDASVHVKVTSKANGTNDFIMPLEFKTGKATNGQAAMEHSAQVMLYTLLMSERYKKNIDYGLLYYLHTDQTQGIAVRRSDLVGLIMRRNELASDILKASTTQQFPPMLQVPNMCKSCRHLNACTIYHKAHNGSIEGSGLGDVYSSLVNHLTTAHCIFLKKWERLIDLEANELEVVRKEMWSSHMKSAQASTCLSSIVLDTSDQVPQKNFAQANRFLYRFMRQDLPQPHRRVHDGDDLNPSSSGQNLECSLKTGDYVILSTDPGRLVVGRGVIMDISRINVTVSFSKRLRLPGSSPSKIIHDLCQEVWRIDKDEFTASFATMRFNLIQMFLQDERSSHLRSMIVDLHAPQYDGGCIFSQDPAVSYIWSEKTLNDDQRKAILKILTAKDYTLILGMPGTGKTSTMVHAVKALLMRGASILLTSYTNSAVDNLLIKLKFQGIDFIRIGREEAVHEGIRGNCINAADMQSTKDIKLRLDEAKVVAVTCLGITSPLLSDKKFDVCIMDEAGQITLPVSLGPLMFASKFVLVGDHYQLPPLVQSTEARENGMGVSLFCRLSEAHPQAISALQSQYRMCAPIMELSNALIYGNRLCCGSPDVANAKLEYTSSTSLPSWLNKVLDPLRPVIFINTDLLPGLEVKDCKTVNNPLEAYIITEIIDKLSCQGIQGEDIGVITPYNSQAHLIKQHVTQSVEIHTIDKYQGRDKDCILVSFVRSSNNPKNCKSSLLGDWHRINVALTRAKKKLIMVGSQRTLSFVPILKLLMEKIEECSTSILNVCKEDIDLNNHHKGGLKRCSQLR